MVTVASRGSQQTKFAHCLIPLTVASFIQSHQVDWSGGAAVSAQQASRIEINKQTNKQIQYLKP